MLDRQVPDELLAATGPETFREIGVTFPEQVTLLAQRIARSDEAGDFGSPERAAHELVGASCTFGASELAHHATSLMTACRACETAHAYDPAAITVSWVARTQDAFSAYLTDVS